MPSPRHGEEAAGCDDENPAEENKDTGEEHAWSVQHECRAHDEADEQLQIVGKSRAGETQKELTGPRRSKK
jgi:hypothetical protein